jgi:hypothetical protein
MKTNQHILSTSVPEYISDSKQHVDFIDNQILKKESILTQRSKSADEIFDLNVKS